MGKLTLVCRLAGRDLRHHWGQALLLLLAVTAATATLSLGLALHGVTAHPYQQTRAATGGPDVVAEFSAGLAGPHQVGQADSGPQLLAQVRGLLHMRGIAGHSGPYPLAMAVVRAHGRVAGVEAEGRDQSPAGVDQPKLTAGRWVSPGGLVIERTFAVALGVSVGDRVTLDGRSFRVAGIAVTAATVPYPNLCQTGCFLAWPPHGPQLSARTTGLAWVTRSAARALARAVPGRCPTC